MPELTLQEALCVLALVHTRDDKFAGFAVVSGSTPRWSASSFRCSPDQYESAWKRVREEIKLPVSPDQYPADANA